ncbi:MAG: hypothetical protein ACD_77C00342G0029 [uncultured bacterium]|nr:MAG: hypothetical protein ACD_77C00342G0029 [uncultured bacterium]
MSVGYRIPKKGILISSGDTKQKAELLSASKMLMEKGFKLYATGGSYRFLEDNNIPATKVYWPSEPDRKPQAMDLLHSKEVDFVINIPKNLTKVELENGYKIRRAAIDLNIPLITNARLASAFINAFCTIAIDQIQIKSWDEYKS